MDELINKTRNLTNKSADNLQIRKPDQNSKLIRLNGKFIKI